MQACDGLKVYFHASLTSVLLEKSGDLHPPGSLISGKDLQLPIEQETGLSPEPMKVRKSVASTGVKTRFLDLPTCTLVAITVALH
jgi:hypothetical protein